MKWIWTVQNTDGSWDEVGMNNRGLIEGNRNKAARTAIDIVNSRGRRVRMQGWLPSEFYTKPKPAVEFVTELGRVEVTKTPPFTVTVSGLVALRALDPAAPSWLRDDHVPHSIEFVNEFGLRK